MKIIFAAILVIAIIGIAGITILAILETRPDQTAPAAPQVVLKPSVTAAPVTAPVAHAPLVQEANATPVSIPKKHKHHQASASVSDGHSLMINGYVVQDPEARAALSLVGRDPNAEAYWASAINNPNLPSEERKDLIEDLNEDGLSDPKHPGPQDMPIIMNRLQIIEQLAPNSMDQADAGAFAEAYKDLANMLNGQPPK